MLAAVEHGSILCSDSNILCLSWKGRVPKSQKDKPVCRRRYYEEGWLATGNGRGVVGVTFTSSHCRRDRSTPQRINFNLRGHNSEVRQAATDWMATQFLWSEGSWCSKQPQISSRRCLIDICGKWPSFLSSVRANLYVGHAHILYVRSCTCSAWTR